MKRMKIEDSLKTILTLTTRVKHLFNQFTYLKNNLRYLDSVNLSEHGNEVPLYQFLVASTLQMMFLSSESILEEYDDILTTIRFPEYEKEILLLKKDIKPAMRRFNKWTNRRQYRNSFVAHNLRWKDKSSLFSTTSKTKINAPYHDNDFVVIYYLHVYMCHCLGRHFNEVIERIDSELIIDKIEFTSEHKSLKDDLFKINEWSETVHLSVSANFTQDEQ